MILILSFYVSIEITNTEFICGKAEDVLPSITDRLPKKTNVVAVVDPPRAGLRKVLLFCLSKFALLWAPSFPCHQFGVFVCDGHLFQRSATRPPISLVLQSYRVSGQAVQPVPLASLKLSMAVYGQKLDGRPSR